jgi:hypothetical protein
MLVNPVGNVRAGFPSLGDVGPELAALAKANCVDHS